jgi:hypothetical protein
MQTLRVQPLSNPLSRRGFVITAAASTVLTLAACSPEAASFQSVDITGADFAKNLRLSDHLG